MTDVFLEGALEDDLEETIEAMMDEPEFKDVDAFMNFKLDDDDLSYSFLELQALARNLTRKRAGKDVSVASLADVESIKRVLNDEMGFKYVGRTPVRQVRGVTSPLNGTNRFANTGGGGSGFGPEGFAAFGGGPGAIGGGTPWDPSDAKNLRMSPSKKR